MKIGRRALAEAQRTQRTIGNEKARLLFPVSFNNKTKKRIVGVAQFDNYAPSFATLRLGEIKFGNNVLE
jgi:hypothetical protein